MPLAELASWAELVLESRGIRPSAVAELPPAESLDELANDPALKAALAAVEGR